jgi:hypothetical protein
MNFDGELRKIGDIDVTRFAQQAAKITDADWTADAFRQKTYEVHKQTQTIRLIMDEDGRHRDPTYHSSYQTYKELLEPVEIFIRRQFEQTLKAKRLRKKHGRGYFIRMILVKLLANGSIPHHVDQGETLSKSHRMHLPIITNEQNLFSVGDTEMHMKAGELWEINNRREHGVVNGGSEDRTHLIVDYVLAGEKIIDADGAMLVC